MDQTTIKILIVMGIFMTGCNKSSVDLKDCEILVNAVIFSKSANNGKSLSIIKDINTVEIESGAKSDFFNAPDGKEKYSIAPLLLTPIDTEKPFTFIAKVTPEFSETYDAGAIYMFTNDNKWLKFAFEMDERKLTRIVTVRTNETSDDNNHDAIEKQSVYLKISSDAESIGYYYSTDSISWQLVKVYKNDFSSTTYIGISSQSPLGKGIKTTFEDITLNNVAIKDFRKGV